MAAEDQVKPISRRIFIQQTITAGAAMMIGCEGGSAVTSSAPVVPKSELLRILPMGGLEDVAPLEVGKMVGSGLDGRRFLELESLTRSKLKTPADQFFVRTGAPQQLPSSDTWSIKVHGLVDQPVDVPLTELAQYQKSMGVHVMECSGNHPVTQYRLISAGDWQGIDVSHLLKRVKIDPRATRVLISGIDNHPVPIDTSVPGASWVFTFDQLKQSGAFFATALGSEPLEVDNGAPLRLIVPGWFGCCDIKWVNEIKLVDDSQPATPHMTEYANRTGQSAKHALARDYKSALMDLAALPIRVEHHRILGDGNKSFFRVVGIMWGGDSGAVTDSLTIRCGQKGSFDPVRFMTPPRATTWSLWQYDWHPQWPGTYLISLKFSDPTLNLRRMKNGYGNRAVAINRI